MTDAKDQGWHNELMDNPLHRPDGRANVLLVWSDPRERQALLRILCASGARVICEIPGTDGVFSIPADCRLVVFDFDSLRASMGQLMTQVGTVKPGPAVLVVTATRDKSDLIELLSQDGLTNLVAKNIDFDPDELIVTVQKILRDDIFKLEKYLTWGISPAEETIRSSADKERILERVGNYLNDIGCNRRLIGLAKGVADEFIMNAVYNAPVEANGKPKYAARARSEVVYLEPGEEARFRFASDGITLAMSIEDRFGRLDPWTVTSYLRRCFMKGADQIDQKDGGAGLGLYCVFESLNHLIINVAPHQRTELIGLMDISGSYRTFAERPKSLNIFLQEHSG